MSRAWVLVLLVAACGRLDFTGASRDASDTTDARTTDVSTTIDAPTGAIRWVQSFAEQHPGAGATDSFTAQAQAAGDALILMIGCADGTTAPTGYGVTAAGWSFTQVADLQTAPPLTSVVVGAIAPDTVATTISVSWIGSTCGGGKAELGDEFANTDPTGGDTTFDLWTEISGQGMPLTSIDLVHADDAVWSVCFAQDFCGVGSGVTPGATNDPLGGDVAEYVLTSSPVGTDVPLAFTNDATTYAVTTVTLKPR